MAAPDPIRIFHFTHLRNLSGIMERGLLSDAHCRREGLTAVEIGSATIRERRLARDVGAIGPGGKVGDYVPWYYGPRSPMMFTLSKNNYEFREGFDEVIYLVSSVPTVFDLGCQWVASDRNAALSVAEFIDDIDALPGHIDWRVIQARYWPDFPDGADLRAAEFLVHQSLPWRGIEAIVTRTTATEAKVSQLLSNAGDQAPGISVRPGWYF